MKRIVLLFVVVVLALSVQAQMSSSSNDDTAQAITQMEQQWAAAAKASDATKVDLLLADNLVNLNSNGTMYNKSQTLDRIKGDKWEVNQISDVKVVVHGNTAIATGKWQGKGTSEGKAVDAYESWVDTWMKMPSGAWQCIATASAPAKM